MTLEWRHNGLDSVSNHQPHDCLLKRLFRRRSKKTSNFRVTGLCGGIHRGPVNSPYKWPVTRKMFPFDDVIMMPAAGLTSPYASTSTVMTKFWAPSQYKDVFFTYGIPLIKIRRSWVRLILIMGMPILVSRSLYIETPLWCRVYIGNRTVNISYSGVFIWSMIHRQM